MALAPGGLLPPNHGPLSWTLLQGCCSDLFQCPPLQVPGAHWASSAERDPLFLQNTWLVKMTNGKVPDREGSLSLFYNPVQPHKKDKYRNYSPIAQISSGSHTYAGTSGIYGVIFPLYSLGINFFTYCVSISNVHAISGIHLALSTTSPILFNPT